MAKSEVGSVSDFIKNFNKIMNAVSKNSRQQLQDSVKANAGKGLTGALQVVKDAQTIRDKGADMLSGRTVVNPADKYTWGNPGTDRGYNFGGSALDTMTPVTINGGANDPEVRALDMKKIKSGEYEMNPADQYGYDQYAEHATAKDIREEYERQHGYYTDTKTGKKYDIKTNEELLVRDDGTLIPRSEIESSESTTDDDDEDDYVEYTYKRGDTFGQVIKNLGLDTGKGLWGSDGDVAYYTKQLRAQGIPGMVPIGTKIRLKRRK